MERLPVPLIHYDPFAKSHQRLTPAIGKDLYLYIYIYLFIYTNILDAYDILCIPTLAEILKLKHLLIDSNVAASSLSFTQRINEYPTVYRDIRYSINWHCNDSYGSVPCSAAVLNLVICGLVVSQCPLHSDGHIKPALGKRFSAVTCSNMQKHWKAMGMTGWAAPQP